MSNADITVTGNVTADPELKFASNGNARLSFSIASNKRFQVNGEWQEETSFFNVVAWRGIAEMAANVLEKGTPVVIKGRLEQRSWENAEGEKRSTVEIVADTVAVNTIGIESLERRRAGGGGGGSSRPAPRQKATVPSSDPFEDF
jgi:single-strand DNA-binding protein